MESRKNIEQREGACEILDATIKDLPDILRINKETWLSTYPNEKYKISREDILSRDFDSPERFTKWKESIESNDGTRKTLVAKVNGVVVGYCSASKSEKINKITSIYVLSESQKLGVGKKLMESVLEWLGRDKKIILSVVKYNTNAINFYKGMGFVEKFDSSDEPIEYTFPSGKKMPEINMILPAG